ncbi:hypothetical protein Ddye_019669 [Dipteronia dyeriana]|uniref:Uncharacterized protein n=1 Tax=Dipteronia dyeriana TaxID=168575 RepID=A0AAD9WUN5_9ROSI|nr:hypothetical protein Ddye_019669 [Dipteronia dyeriana]
MPPLRSKEWRITAVSSSIIEVCIVVKVMPPERSPPQNVTESTSLHSPRSGQVKRFHRNNIAAIIDKTVRPYTELKYNRHMENLCNLHQNAFNYVMEAGPHKWSCVYCPEGRYMVMTTNVSEYINSCLKFARQLPMLALAEFIRDMLQRWFHDRHRAAQSMRHQLTDATHFVTC